MNHVSFAWQGGEPTLLGIPFFERVVALQKQYANGKTIDNAFQTNGTLLDDAWGEFLARNKFLIGLSIDGPEEVHDAYRVDKGGKPTHARVMRGLSILKKHGVEFNTLTVINRLNSYSSARCLSLSQGDWQQVSAIHSHRRAACQRAGPQWAGLVEAVFAAGVGGLRMVCRAAAIRQVPAAGL